jgi:cold shock CspA family protein
VNGKMLWFNETRGEGLIESDAGERVVVRRSAFVEGAPVGRCKGLEVEFAATIGPDGWIAAEATLVPARSPRRTTRHNTARLLR